jgi:type I restriction-modification system DNA methylase subunit
LEEHAAGDLEVGFLVAARKLLAANGRAAIAISTRVATARSARLIEARGDLINSGHIEAIIALPTNLHDGRSRPISIVVMAGTPQAGPLLLVDATACGTQRRRHRELSEVETMGIVDIVRRGAAVTR